MAADALAELFDRYRREGDLAALALVFEEVAPELLRLARHLQPRGQTPEDLVQATFLAALTHRERFDASRPLRPWLFGILVHKAAGGRMRPLELEGDVSDPVAPVDPVETEESARLLARGLERLPPIYSEVLREHFFAGRAPGEIAAHLGRPPGTVRAQLHRGLRLLRSLLPLGLAGWLAWLGPSRASLLRMRRAVLDAAPGATTRRAGAPPLVGARLVGAGAVVAAGWLGLRAVDSAAPTPARPTATAEAVAEEPRTIVEPGARDRAVLVDVPPEPATASTTHGALLVRVTFADGTPAADIGLRIYAWGEPSWAENRTYGVTDGAGEFLIDSIRAGRVGLYCDRNGDQGFGATVEPDARALREIELPVGVRVEGVVVDARGVPVPGAGVWLSEAPVPRSGRIAATCDEHGRFALRDVSPRRFFSARADGYAPSEVEWLASGGVREGERAELRLELRDAGGSVSGRVIGADGAPLADAQVALRAPSPRTARLRADGILLGPPTTSETRSDAQGRFTLVDLALAEVQLAVSAPGHADHVEVAQLTPERPHLDLEPRLTRGGSLSGRVRFPDGEPALGSVVIANGGVGEQHDLPVDADGRFAFEHVAPGTVRIQAGFGHGLGGPLANTSRELEAGDALHWEAVVERPREYAGRVLGPDGLPLAGVWVRSATRANDGASLPAGADDLAPWLNDWPDRMLRHSLEQVATDAEGRFVLRGLAPDFTLEVRPRDGRKGWAVWDFDAPPAHGELALPATALHTSGLRATVTGPDGVTLGRGEVYVARRTGGELRGHLDATGDFRFAALPPGTFDVLVWARGLRPQVAAVVELAEAEQRDLGVLRLAR